jgi:putative transcriptional regulator
MRYNLSVRRNTVMIENRVSLVLGARRRSVKEVAAAAGISRGALHRLWHGRAEQVSLRVLDALCRELRCQVGDLFVYVPDAHLPHGSHLTHGTEAEGRSRGR